MTEFSCWRGRHAAPASADFQSLVCNLPGGEVGLVCEFRTTRPRACRLRVGGTADYKSALRKDIAQIFNLPYRRFITFNGAKVRVLW